MDRSFFLRNIAALGASGIAIPTLLSGYFSPGLTDPDWGLIRKHFSLPEDYHYFNTGGIGAVPIKVREEYAQYWDTREIHPRPGHDESNWHEVKKLLADMLGAQDQQDYFALTNSATEGINIVLNGYAWEKGDEIITSSHEHPALLTPLINIANRFGVHVKTFEPDLESGINNLTRIFELCSSKTRMIFISMVTCTSGQLFPVDEIIGEAHRKGILVALDGAQSTGNRVLNLLDLDVDFYTSGGQKWLLGPKRTGFLYVKRDSLEKILPTTVGAYSAAEYDIQKSNIKWSFGAERFEYATQNESLFYALGKSIRFLNTLGVEEIQKHNESLVQKLYEKLLTVNGAFVISPLESQYRSSMLSFGLKGLKYSDLASQLSSKGFRVRMVSEAGLEAVRVSCHVYNSKEEIEELVSAIKEIQKTIL